MKIVADIDIPFLKGVLEPFAEVVYLRGEEIRADDVRDADALLVRTRTRCDAALLSGSRVRMVGTTTIGFDHIDMSWCAAHGVEVATAAGCNARAVLQWVSAALAWMASAPTAGLAHPVGLARMAPERGLNPCETTLGVVGVGNVGSLVARYAASWGFRVMCSDPPRERAEGFGEEDGFYSLDALAAECDAITFHVPLVSHGPDATEGLVGREFLASMRPGAVILNSSRGAVIEPEALREAVGSGNQKFILDVWNDEPRIDRTVLERTLIATPHIAGYSTEGKATATAMVVNALAREFGLSLPPAGSDNSNRAGLDDWYPSGVPKSIPREISWSEMCARMPLYFDIDAESALLKSAPEQPDKSLSEQFEQMRDNYIYRTEFF
ncbi:MAG: 4-phosphoerythronate dehydrogenase [Alistipes sp.]|nr:4-phosphoerythronate dehydrogenase [Alistipes sp.]